MSKYFFSIVYILLIPITLHAQLDEKHIVRWDQKMIKEAGIWKKLLVDYNSADLITHWPERKSALIGIIEDYPNSQWADDAYLLLEGQNAIVENDIDGSIKRMRNIIEKYPTGNTIITSWNINTGCQINDAWLMWAPSRVFLNNDNTIRIAFPFDKDDRISLAEEEALTYFEHLERHPQSTKDIARYIIALMLREKSDIAGAITELEGIINEYPDLSEIRNPDYEEAKRNGGRLIECEPPYNQRPIMRVQYSACLLLIDLYQARDNMEKLNNLILRLSSECSPDGWYWSINKHLGDVYIKINKPDLAIKQYDMAISGIHKIAKSQSIKMKALYDNGNIVLSENFINWEEETLKPYNVIIDKIQKRKNEIDLNK